MTLAEAKVLYEAKQTTVDKLAEIFGKSRYTMRKLLASVGTQIRSAAESRTGKIYVKAPKVSEPVVGAKPGTRDYSEPATPWCKPLAHNWARMPIRVAA